MKKNSIIILIGAAAAVLLACASVLPDRKGRSADTRERAVPAEIVSLPCELDYYPASSDGGEVLKAAEATVCQAAKASLLVQGAYRPLQFASDSAFAPYCNPEFIRLALRLAEKQEKYRELTEKLSGRLNGSSAKDYEANLRANLEEQRQCMTEMTKCLRQGYYHSGWLIYHRFMAGLLEAEQYFILDKTGKEIEMKLTREEMNRYVKFLETDGKWFVFEKYHND